MCISVEFIKKDTFVHSKKVLSKCVSLRIHQERHICTAAERAVQMCISVQIHQERQICTDAETAVQMCIPVEFIKKDTFPQTQKELYKCVSLSNSSRKTHLYRRRNSYTNVHLCPNSSRKTHLYRCRKSSTNVYLCRIDQERHICTGAERAVEIYLRNHQERHICTAAEKAVQMCISVEFIKKDTFVHTQKQLYKSVSLSKSSRKTNLHRRRKTCTNVYLCRIHQERHICTGAERAVQKCISVEIIEKDTFVQVQKELYKCVSLSEFMKKDTFVKTQKSCTNVYLCRIHQERHICTGAKKTVQIYV